MRLQGHHLFLEIHVIKITPNNNLDGQCQYCICLFLLGPNCYIRITYDEFYSVVHVRETRLTGIFSHIMIGLSLLLLPYPMSYIPRPVLDGLFLYIAITALFGNQMFDRIMLLLTEQV